MTVTSQDQIKIVRQLIAVAGNLETVERALRQLQDENADVENMEVVLRRILRLRREKTAGVIAHR